MAPGTEALHKYRALRSSQPQGMSGLRTSPLRGPCWGNSTGGVPRGTLQELKSPCCRGFSIATRGRRASGGGAGARVPRLAIWGPRVAVAVLGLRDRHFSLACQGAARADCM